MDILKEQNLAVMMLVSIGSFAVLVLLDSLLKNIVKT